MKRGDAWTSVNVDPSAGVPLVPRVVRCPRCDVVKGPKWSVRPGLCADCRETLTLDERKAWAA